MEEIVKILLTKVAEAIYFSAFLIVGKRLKEKRILFTIIMILEYLLFKQFLKYNVAFQLLYTFMSFVNLKVLYKEKAQITDLILFLVASAILILSSIFCYFIIYFTINEYIWVLITNRILIFGIVYFGRNKIYELYKEFCSLWNRHNYPNKIKSLTLRNLSIIILNLMFWLINIGMALTLILGQGT